jgi:hypothetical protein
LQECVGTLWVLKELYSIIYWGGTVKNFICVFALVVMVGLVGCAGIGKGKKASTGGSQLSPAHLQEMNITCWGFCSISKDNSK